ncbi:MAG: sigma factor-like helix-turn-helix DNA-binding protein [Negativicutes bacterium]|nr:sigma factor-like helix-turn-helix DNA-binding protein [Negativicutes bacterium]
MQGYSDYYRLTEGYLKNYKAFRMALENLRRVRSHKEQELIDARLPIARYGMEPRSGGELTPTESESDRELILQREIYRLSRDILSLQIKVEQVALALGALPGQDRKLIDFRYGEKRPWKEIADEIGYSERQCKRRTYKAVEQICVTLFGFKTVIHQKYCFVS